MPRSQPRRRPSGRTRAGTGAARARGFVLLLVCIAAASGGAYLAVRGNLLNDAVGFFASAPEVALATAPQPRSGEAPAVADKAAADETPPGEAQLAEMQPSVAAEAAETAPPSWPALSPAALLRQAALTDRALTDTAFDQPPRLRYARPFTPPASRPVMAVIVTGLGGDRAITAAAIAGLPADVTLSFDPYAPELGDWIAAARAFGHEAMLDLPMQSKAFPAHDPGPLGLLIALNDGEIGRRIDAAAGSGEHAVGFISAGGDAFLLDPRATRAALGEIARLGLGFIDATGEPMSQAGPAAADAGLALARTGLQLDETPSRTAITEQLTVAAQTAIKEGHALAVAQGSPIVIVSVADWARRQTEAAPLLAPASALFNQGAR